MVEFLNIVTSVGILILLLLAIPIITTLLMFSSDVVCDYIFKNFYKK